MGEYEFIVDAIKKAGELLLAERERGFTTESKGGDPRDIVTSVDRDVSNFLTTAVHERFPGDAIYSEEGDTHAQGKRLWTIDPIDGSANFSRGIPHFAVCLGLVEDGVPVAGAVYNPVTRELFSFKKGGGAFLNAAPIRVSRITELGDAHVLFHAGRDPKLAKWGGASYTKLLQNVRKTKNLSSSGLDACFVAAGRVEANIYGTLSSMDISPALGVLNEAGGVASDRAGRPLALSTEVQRIYAANSSPMLEKVRTLLEGD